MPGWGDFFIRNERGMAERVDWIRHIEEGDTPGVVEIAVEDAKYANDILEVAIARPRIPIEWEWWFKAKKVRQFELPADDPRRSEPWVPQKGVSWFQYQIVPPLWLRRPVILASEWWPILEKLPDIWDFIQNILQVLQKRRPDDWPEQRLRVASL